MLINRRLVTAGAVLLALCAPARASFFPKNICIGEDAAGASFSSDNNPVLVGCNNGGTVETLACDGSGNLAVTVGGTVACAESGAWTVSQSGTWTVQQGTPPWSVSQSGTWNLNNISGTVSLPTGAATSAKQPAFGTAGTASADVLTVQGRASMTPLLVDGTGGTFPTGGLTDTQLRATPVPVSGTVAITAAALPLPSGASTAANQSTEITSLSSIATSATSIDGKIPSQVGGRIPVDASGVSLTCTTGGLTDTQLRAAAVPISVATLPLPSGAATAAKQPALGTAGTASADVITVQGKSGMTAVVVDGTGGTFPITVATLPLPSGAATSALQGTGNTSLASIDGKLAALGTQAIASSISVTPATSSVWAASQSGTWNIGTLTSITNPVAVSKSGTWSGLGVTAADGDVFVRSNAASTFPVNIGTWIGSAAPTVGQKAMASSVPVVPPSDWLGIADDSSTSIAVDCTSNGTVYSLALGHSEAMARFRVLLSTCSTTTLQAVCRTDSAATWAVLNVYYEAGGQWVTSLQSAADAIYSAPVGGCSDVGIKVTGAGSGAATASIVASRGSMSVKDVTVRQLPSALGPTVVNSSLSVTPATLSTWAVTKSGTWSGLGVTAADGDVFVRSTAASTFPVNLGTWIGSSAPTVGSKASASSIPVVIASDQGAIPSITTVGTVTAVTGITNALPTGSHTIGAVTGTSAQELALESTQSSVLGYIQSLSIQEGTTDGAVNSSGPMVQGRVSTAAPSYVDTAIEPVSMDTSGNVRVNLTTSTTVPVTVGPHTGSLWQIKGSLSFTPTLITDTLPPSPMMGWKVPSTKTLLFTGGAIHAVAASIEYYRVVRRYFLFGYQATAAPSAPAAPTVALAACTAGIGTSGAFLYKTAPIDTFRRESAITVASASSTLTSTNQCVTVTPAAAGTGVIGYNIYRTLAGGSTYYYVGTTPGAAAYVDAATDAQLDTSLTPSATWATGAIAGETLPSNSGAEAIVEVGGVALTGPPTSLIYTDSYSARNKMVAVTFTNSIGGRVRFKPWQETEAFVAVETVSANLFRGSNTSDIRTNHEEDYGVTAVLGVNAVPSAGSFVVWGQQTIGVGQRGADPVAGTIHAYTITPTNPQGVLVPANGEIVVEVGALAAGVAGVRNVELTGMLY